MLRQYEGRRYKTAADNDLYHEHLALDPAHARRHAAIVPGFAELHEDCESCEQITGAQEEKPAKGLSSSLTEEDVLYLGKVRKRPTRAAEKAGWRQQIQDEIDELGDLYGEEY